MLLCCYVAMLLCCYGTCIHLSSSLSGYLLHWALLLHFVPDLSQHRRKVLIAHMVKHELVFDLLSELFEHIFVSIPPSAKDLSFEDQDFDLSELHQDFYVPNQPHDSAKPITSTPRFKNLRNEFPVCPLSFFFF